jgi:hypothetical protein
MGRLPSVRSAGRRIKPLTRCCSGRCALATTEREASVDNFRKKNRRHSQWNLWRERAMISDSRGAGGQLPLVG